MLALAISLAISIAIAPASAAAETLAPPRVLEHGGASAVSSGRVQLALDIDAAGTVENVRVVDVIGDDPEGLVSAATTIVRESTFSPAREHGVPVASRAVVAIELGGQSAITVTVIEATAAGEPRTPLSIFDEGPVTPPPAGVQAEDATSEVRRVRVQTEEPRRDAVAGSDFDIEPGKLADVPRGSAEKMLTLAPGFFLVNEGGEGHPSGFYLRGFDAGVGQDIEFTVDGVPLNEPSNAHSHGFADTLFVIPEVVRRVRVTEGPFDARQGDFAVAGSAAYELGVDQRGVRASAGYGRFNTARALALWAPADFSPGTFVAVDVKRGDGFGTNRAHQAVRAMAGFEHPLPRGFLVDLLATGYATQFDSAGVLRQDDFEARRISGCDEGRDAQFFCSYDPNQGGAMTRFGASARVARHRERDSFSQMLWVTRRGMRVRENFTGYMLDPRTDGGPQRGDGLEQRYGAWTVGTRGSYALRRPWRRRVQELELGYGVRYDDADSSSRRLRRAGGAPYDVVFDAGLRIVDVSLWAAATLRPLDRLDLNLGIRMDAFSYGVLDRNRPAMDRDGPRETSEAFDAYGINVGPRTSVVVNLLRWPRAPGLWGRRAARGEPGAGRLDWLTAYGIGTRSSDATALSDGEFAPFARVQSAETGLRALWDGIGDRFGFEARAVAFYTHVDRDLVFDPETARNQPVGESNRFGALGTVRARVHDWLDVQTSVTWSEAHLPPADAGAFDWAAGPRVPYVPRLVFRGDAALFHDFWIRRQPFDWTLAVGLSHVTPRPLPLDAFGTPYTVADLAARLRWRWIELAVEIQNLTDARYHQLELFYVSNFASPTARPSMLPALHFAAGAPLTAMGVLTLHFEPDARTRLEARRRARGKERR